MALTKVTRNLLSTGIDDQSTSTAMTIDSSGNLLVGTTDTNPSNNGASGEAGIALSGSGYISAARSSESVGLFNRMDSDGSILLLRKDGTDVGSIGSGSDELIIGTTDTGLRFYDFGDAIIPRSTSNGTRDGTTDLGASGNRFKDLYLSGGVYVGGTTSADYLDDYEEGTWTPAYSSNGGLSTVSGITSASGQYVKIGQFVHITGQFTLNGSSGTAIVPGDYVTITGLPYTVETKHASGTVYTSRAFTNLGGFTGATYWYAGSYAVIQFLGQGNTTWSGDEDQTVYFSMNFRDSD